MNKIKAVIADVDGVMVGKEEGVNFPLPHRDVIDALRRLVKSGVPVVLCSAKFRAAIDDIITQAELANPHITDGGALIINPLGEPKIIEQNIIDRATVIEYLSTKRGDTELYTATTCYMEKSTDSVSRERRAALLQTKPVVVDSLVEVARTADAIKLTILSHGQDDMPAIEKHIKRFGAKLHYIWSYHPWTAPRRPCVITAASVSKQHAARKVAAYLGIPFSAVLGIGDSPADWSFMELCGYAGTVGDNRELRELAQSKGPGHYFEAASVDDHGLLDILSHFNLR